MAIEVVRRAWEEKEGVALEVGDFGGNPDYLCLRTNNDPQSKAWFGPLEISMTSAFARDLGRALIACADDKESK
jgi:hypothetical protein